MKFDHYLNRSNNFFLHTVQQLSISYSLPRPNTSNSSNFFLIYDWYSLYTSVFYMWKLHKPWQVQNAYNLRVLDLTKRFFQSCIQFFRKYVWVKWWLKQFLYVHGCLRFMRHYKRNLKLLSGCFPNLSLLVHAVFSLPDAGTCGEVNLCHLLKIPIKFWWGKFQSMKILGKADSR